MTYFINYTQRKGFAVNTYRTPAAYVTLDAKSFLDDVTTEVDSCCDLAEIKRALEAGELWAYDPDTVARLQATITGA